MESRPSESTHKAIIGSLKRERELSIGEDEHESESDNNKKPSTSDEAIANAITYINDEITNAQKENRNFHIPYAKREELKDILGVDRMVEVVFNAMRANKTPIVHEFSYRLTDYTSCIESTIKYKQVLIKTGAEWSYTKGNIKNIQTVNITPDTGTVFYYFSTAIANSLAMLLNGDIRYSVNVNYRPSVKSAVEQWNNDDRLKQAIKFNLERKKTGVALSLTRLRSDISFKYNVYTASAFPIPVMMLILEGERKRLNRPLRYVDPCAGWGDRLTGSLLVGNEICASYTGIDPWDVAESLFHRTYKLLGNETRCRAFFIKGAAQEVEWPEADLVFTSPPYGLKECYNITSGNVHDKQAWRLKGKDFFNQFLVPLLRKAADCTRNSNGRVMINIDNDTMKKQDNNLTDELLEAAKLAGLEHERTDGMGKKYDDKTKKGVGEPVFVFKHGNAEPQPGPWANFFVPTLVNVTRTQVLLARDEEPSFKKSK